MERHYHRTDIASYGDLMDGFVPIDAETREAFRYNASGWQVDQLLCRSWAPITDREHVVLLMEPETGRLFLALKWAESDEQVIVVKDTPLMIDEANVGQADAVAGVIIPTGTPESTLPMDFRNRPLPVSMLSPAAVKACASNGRRPFRQWEWESVKPVSDFTDARAWFARLDDWKRTAEGQSLAAGRGEPLASTPTIDRLRGFLRSL